MIFNLVEKTHGPWLGRVWRSEEMTAEEAESRNRQISVMQWEPSQFQENDNDNAAPRKLPSR